MICALVRETRIELAWVAPYAPQTYASTISAIPAAARRIIVSLRRGCKTEFRYSDYSSLDRSSFADPDDVKEIEEIAFDQVFWERIYVASAEEPIVQVPPNGLGNDSSLAADSSLANEAVCQDSGDAEFADLRKPTIDSENLDSFEGEAPGTLFAIHFDFWRSVKHAVYPATLYVYSYEAIR